MILVSGFQPWAAVHDHRTPQDRRRLESLMLQSTQSSPSPDQNAPTSPEEKIRAAAEAVKNQTKASLMSDHHRDWQPVTTPFIPGQPPQHRTKVLYWHSGHPNIDVYIYIHIQFHTCYIVTCCGCFCPRDKRAFGSGPASHLECIPSLKLICKWKAPQLVEEHGHHGRPRGPFPLPCLFRAVYA